MKPIMRTTIILDEELRNKLKMLSIQKDISMKEIITLALEEWIRSESSGSFSHVHDRAGENKFTQKIIDELEPVIGLPAARALLAQKCAKHGVNMKKMMRSDFSRPLVESIIDGVDALATAQEAARVKKKLLAMAKKEAF